MLTAGEPGVRRAFPRQVADLSPDRDRAAPGIVAADGRRAGGGPQQAEGVSYAPKVEVEDARLDWSHPAVALDRQVRACTPAPGAWTTYAGERLKVGPVTVVDTVLPPGELAVTKREVLVGTGTTAVRLGDVTPHGRKQMAAADWARGVRLETGSTLGDSSES